MVKASSACVHGKLSVGWMNGGGTRKIGSGVSGCLLAEGCEVVHRCFGKGEKVCMVTWCCVEASHVVVHCEFSRLFDGSCIILLFYGCLLESRFRLCV